MTRLYLQYRPRVILVNTLVTGLLLAVIGKLFYVQILEHDVYHNRAQRQSTNVEVLPAIRGNIEDRNGELLTSNIIHYSFAADPQVIEHPDTLVTLFARTFHRPAAYYRKQLAADRSFVWLERNVSRSRCGEILAHQPQGLIVRREVRRRYPYGHIIAPLVGFTDVDGKGISGIELEYDTFLRGKKGWQVLRRDAKGRVLFSSGDNGQMPIHGARLRLTIDIDYQSIFQEELARAYERLAPRTIHGILIDPRTGEILALAQHPSFDPNRPWASPAADQRLRAITDMYEPGSTLKVVPATAALDAQICSPVDEFDCENGEFAYHSLLIKDTFPSDTLTFSEIIAHSSNIGIVKIAENLGPDLIYKFCYRFGLGARAGIGLPGESPGLLRKPVDWSAVSTGGIAMGHEVGVTTLQLGLIYSSVANGGQLMRPLLVADIQSPEGKELVTNRPEVIRRVASPATMEQLRRILYYVVEEGTGSEARLPGYAIAGKTGTAQKFLDGSYSDKEFVATFAAMFPADEPKLVCLVAVDSPKYGSHFGSGAAAPIVRNTIKRILNQDDDFYIPPQPSQMSAQEKLHTPYTLATAGLLPADTTPGVVPDFRGSSLRKALRLARRAGVRLQMEGFGRVVRQSIKPGTLVDFNEVCLITLAPESE
ncbi:MAG: transpeptidase family protein [Fidelibacterota bacterium]|nr:MAG: transpeptidase family protein [Candidatus Neomarinimicrobiota bacterium]